MSAYSPLQILIPVFNDWESVRKLLPLVGEQLRTSGRAADVLLVDDGSSLVDHGLWNDFGPVIARVRILRLRRNLGHQRALCVALCHLQAQTGCERVLVMDGDGEDAPSDIPRLLTALDENPKARIVFAERVRRSEGAVFTMFYMLYRWLHRVLVGQRVRVGNFSVMRRDCLEGLCCSPELWNHFAAAVFATRQPMAFIPTQRAHRLAGQSKMNFPGLVMHGLSALAVFADRISTRLLIATAALSVSTILLAAVYLLALLTIRMDPLWWSYLTHQFVSLLIQISTFLLVFCLLVFTFCFQVLFARMFNPFIPIRDYVYFIRTVDGD